MTGIELIAQERKEQLEKHNISIFDDIKYNQYDPLIQAASGLLAYNSVDNKTEDEDYAEFLRPVNWDKDRWIKMCNKPYKERLIIAGALIAAGLDRIINLENASKPNKL